ncbi:MAG: HigA family addiction module antidote protein [Acidobacteria bacterium]|nr:HigA family addiction module antidote protein [Acidobacteriota bacterium]
MARRKKRRLAPVHPGEVLQDILRDAHLSANALALALRIPADRIGAILQGERGITADRALRLARYFGTSAAMWMNLQTNYELEIAENLRRHRIEREVLPRPAA